MGGDKRVLSEKTLFPGAEDGARRHDDVVVEVDVDRLEGATEAGGHLDVRSRRGRVS